jgi:uncharacterized protein
VKQALSLVAALWLAVTAACAQQPQTSGDTPTQLRSFARSTLTIQRRDGRDTFRIWLAETPAQHQQGLMWVRTLAADQGMLFVLNPSREMSMWMKNTYVPLDMLFVDGNGRIVHIHHQAVPLSEDIIFSGQVVRAVVEIRGGEAKRRSISVGDLIQHAAFDAGK